MDAFAVEFHEENPDARSKGLAPTGNAAGADDPNRYLFALGFEEESRLPKPRGPGARRPPKKPKEDDPIYKKAGVKRARGSLVVKYDARTERIGREAEAARVAAATHLLDARKTSRSLQSYTSGAVGAKAVARAKRARARAGGASDSEDDDFDAEPADRPHRADIADRTDDNSDATNGVCMRAHTSEPHAALLEAWRRKQKPQKRQRVAVADEADEADEADAPPPPIAPPPPPIAPPLPPIAPPPATKMTKYPLSKSTLQALFKVGDSVRARCGAHMLGSCPGWFSGTIAAVYSVRADGDARKWPSGVHAQVAGNYDGFVYDIAYDDGDRDEMLPEHAPGGKTVWIKKAEPAAAANSAATSPPSSPARSPARKRGRASTAPPPAAPPVAMRPRRSARSTAADE